MNTCGWGKSQIGAFPLSLVHSYPTASSIYFKLHTMPSTFLFTDCPQCICMLPYRDLHSMSETLGSQWTRRRSCGRGDEPNVQPKQNAACSGNFFVENVWKLQNHSAHKIVICHSGRRRRARHWNNHIRCFLSGWTTRSVGPVPGLFESVHRGDKGECVHPRREWKQQLQWGKERSSGRTAMPPQQISRELQCTRKNWHL